MPQSVDFPLLWGWHVTIFHPFEWVVMVVLGVLACSAAARLLSR